MGQYYEVLTKDVRGNYAVYNRRVSGQYTAAKLTEHSWMGNNFVDTFCNKLYNKKLQVAWVGDYADDGKLVNGLTKEDVDAFYDMVYSRTHGLKEHGVRLNKLNYEGKYLVNHTKQVFINLDNYQVLNEDSDGWIAHPLPLLTAIGNGQGGGDYWGTNEDKIGSWAFDMISIVDKEPQGYKEQTYIFISDSQTPRQEKTEFTTDVA